jgi:hypothetical protein
VVVATVAFLGVCASHAEMSSIAVKNAKRMFFMSLILRFEYQVSKLLSHKYMSGSLF